MDPGPGEVGQRVCESKLGRGLRVLASGNNRRWAERLDQYDFGELLANREACIADLADEVGLAREELDDLVLAKAKFTKAILNLRCRAELFDPNRHSRFHQA